MTEILFPVPKHIFCTRQIEIIEREHKLPLCPSIRPSHFCPEHVSKSIEGYLMKLDTLIEGHEENRRMQEP